MKRQPAGAQRVAAATEVGTGSSMVCARIRMTAVIRFVCRSHDDSRQAHFPQTESSAVDRASVRPGGLRNKPAAKWDVDQSSPAASAHSRTRRESCAASLPFLSAPYEYPGLADSSAVWGVLARTWSPCTTLASLWSAASTQLPPSMPFLYILHDPTVQDAQPGVTSV